MPLRTDYIRKDLHFNFKARTSRGAMSEKTSWIIRLWSDADPSIVGYGEAGPLKGLSIDHRPDFEERLQDVVSRVNGYDNLTLSELPKFIAPEFPSIMFAYETALLDLQGGGKRMLFRNSFTGGASIPINGLIWMGNLDFMMTQINEKIAKGFRCIKLKVGGLDFDSECDVLSYIRKKYYRENIVIRLDANGAFKLDDVLYKLEELSKFQIHSIEQPIKPGLEEMEELCRKSPVPIAFDEELIGHYTTQSKLKLLASRKPQYIILKPTMHGGIQECREWISIAERLKIGWWITSALESNIGLNAICQFTAEYPVVTTHGLGTGAIYNNNFPSPLSVSEGTISLRKDINWDLKELQD